MKVTMPALTKLVDVAKAAGVSRGTASNVFAHPELVRPELRERVEAAARELDYSGPDPKGRLLRAGKFNAIGVVPAGAYGLSSAFGDLYMRDFMLGVARVCDEQGSSLTLVSGLEDDRASGIRNALVDGFILHNIDDAAFIEPARRRKLPFVVVDIEGGADASSVRIDDRAGARLAAEHLVALGHRRFAIMSVMREKRASPIFHGPGEADRRLLTGFPPDRARLSGYAEVFAEAGVSIDDVPIIEARVRNVEDVEMFLDRVPEATAVLTTADSLALSLLDEARRRSISVPRDLSVVGFDDIPKAALADPPLTTIVQPIVEKGRVAAGLLFEGGPARHVVLPVHLVVRGSTAPPRAR